MVFIVPYAIGTHTTCHFQLCKNKKSISISLPNQQIFNRFSSRKEKLRGTFKVECNVLIQSSHLLMGQHGRACYLLSRSLHEKNPWKPLEEHKSDDIGHCVLRSKLSMKIEHQNGIDLKTPINEKSSSL